MIISQTFRFTAIT